MDALFKITLAIGTLFLMTLVTTGAWYWLELLNGKNCS